MKYINDKIVYEVGDWIVLLFETEKLTTVQIEKANETFIYYKPYIESSIGKCNYSGEQIRPATQGEINKATKEEKIMVGDNEVKFFNGTYDENKIQVGCQIVNKELFLKIAKKAGWL